MFRSQKSLFSICPSARPRNLRRRPLRMAAATAAIPAMVVAVAQVVADVEAVRVSLLVGKIRAVAHGRVVVKPASLTVDATPEAVVPVVAAEADQVAGAEAVEAVEAAVVAATLKAAGEVEVAVVAEAARATLQAAVVVVTTAGTASSVLKACSLKRCSSGSPNDPESNCHISRYCLVIGFGH